MSANSPSAAKQTAAKSQASGLNAPEVFGRSAMLPIIAALPPIEAAYAIARFTIMRSKLLSVMDLLLPTEGRILDVGCGFGLFAAYFAQTQPQRIITGVDSNARRIAMAQSHALDRPHAGRILGL